MRTKNETKIDLELVTFSFGNEYRNNSEYAVFLAEDVLSNHVQLSLRIAYSEKAIRDLTEAGKLTNPVESDDEITDWATKLGKHGIRPAIEEGVLTPEQVHSVMRHPLGLQVASDRLRAMDDDFIDLSPIQPPKGTVFDDSPTAISVLATSPEDKDKAKLRSKLEVLLKSLVEYLGWPEEAVSDAELLDHLCAIQRENEVGKRYRDRVGPTLVAWAEMKGDVLRYPTAKAKLFASNEKHWRQVILNASVRIAIDNEKETKFPKFLEQFRNIQHDSLDSVSERLTAIGEDLGLGDDPEFRLYRLNLWDRICVASERFEALVA